jgi:signal transduction histidine kinase
MSTEADALRAYLRDFISGDPRALEERLDRASAEAAALSPTAGVAAGAEAMTAAFLAALVVETLASPSMNRSIVRENETCPRLVREIATQANLLAGAQIARVAMLALDDPTTMDAPLHLAVRTHITLLVGLTGAKGFTAWKLEEGHEPALTAFAGEADPELHSRSVRGAITGAGARFATVVCAFGEPCAVLAWTPGYAEPDGTRVLAQRSARMLTIAFERARLLDGEVTQRSVIAHGAERRLNRLAFDLHDGVMQDLSLLCGELKLLHSTLDQPAAPGTVPRNPSAMVQDALAIAESANEELRDIATTIETSGKVRKPFPDALAGTLRAFAMRSGIEPKVNLEGDLSELVPIVNITMVRVIGEALNNAHAHGGASEVEIAVRATGSTIEASIKDNGCGFDVGAAMPEAARRGSLGLVGMIERMRLIEGTCRVYSQPGLGTTVSLSFKRTPAEEPAAPAMTAAEPATTTLRMLARRRSRVA